MKKLGKEYKQIAARFLGCNLASYYNWAKDKRPVISFVEKYLTQENLQEFLQTGKVTKFDNADRLQEILKLLKQHNPIEMKMYLARSYAFNVQNMMFDKKDDVVRKNYNNFNVLKEIYLILSLVVDETTKKKEMELYYRNLGEKKPNFKNILTNFNEMINFDFSENDIPVINQIISRYEVYNTLYDLDKTQ